MMGNFFRTKGYYVVQREKNQWTILIEKCTHVLAQTAANRQRYLLSQKKADQFTVVNVCQNTEHKEDFRVLETRSNLCLYFFYNLFQ